MAALAGGAVWEFLRPEYAREPCDVQVNHLEHYRAVSAQLQDREREQHAVAVWELLRPEDAWEGTCAPDRSASLRHYS